MALRQHIPNLLTLCGLACGSLSAALAFPHAGLQPTHLYWGAILILAAGLFDVLDGLAARLLKASSPTGQILDSLADLVSFGLAPGLLLFGLLSNYFYTYLPGTGGQADWSAWPVAARLSCLLLPLGAAWRLARFSADTTPRPYFQGLPAPANGLFVAGLLFLFFVEEAHLAPLILVPDNALLTYTLDKPANVILLNLVLSLLMVSKVRMLSFKFKKISWQTYRWHYLFLACSLLLILFLGPLAVFPVGLLYLLCSFLARNTYA
ncbi:MAG: CDP-alcohol phosphatidyltransferase family protein [Bacteroidetes bacterium]|nr:CDP-alcohol phosphatidyltransferase family protein [Bacteroidota bacterium]